jgi:hypothetical protein
MRPRALLVAIALVLAPAPAAAHVGSPDVFFEGDAGPYRLFVSIRTPDVIPGVATIEIRAASSGIREITVVPLRLTGPGSELPPVPDVAARSAEDPQFFMASLWLMEHGSLQVRIAVDGDQGPGKLAIPVAAVAQRTATMSGGLAALLFALMAVLGLSLIAIVAGAVRDGGLATGAMPMPADRRRGRIAAVAIGAIVVAILGGGKLWWDAEAAAYERMVARPWVLEPRVDGCTLDLGPVEPALLLDHGHELHLFALRLPALDHLAHLHPTRDARGHLVQTLPALPPGRYRLFADVVLRTGFPLTGTAELELDASRCGAPTGDDATAAGPSAQLDGDATMTLETPRAELRAGRPVSLAFRVSHSGGPVTLEPYLGMAGHAAVVRRDLGVFAHLHPAGSIAMPALDLAQRGIGVTDPHAGHVMHVELPPRIAFPYGFPTAGAYRVFVQVKRAGRIETAAFDLEIAD